MAYLETPRRRSAKGVRISILRDGVRLIGSRPEWWIPMALVVAALTGWEWQVRAGRLSPLFFPAPSVIARTVTKLFSDGELVMNVIATLLRLFLGLVCGSVPGLVLGLIMGWSRALRVVVDPFIAALHPVPKVAILPLLMIIFGIGESTNVIVIAVAAFFPMLISTMAGVRQISPIHFEVAENYGASLIKVFTRVVVPGSLPLILAGIRLAINIALLVTIAVELVAAQKGLGAVIWMAHETLRTEQLYASLVVIAALGISFNAALQWMMKRLVPWQVEREI